MTHLDKAALRETIFRHLDGIVTVPTACTLLKNGVTAYILKEQEVDVDIIAKKFNANAGYLNVALRILLLAGLVGSKHRFKT